MNIGGEAIQQISEQLRLLSSIALGRVVNHGEPLEDVNTELREKLGELIQHD